MSWAEPAAELDRSASFFRSASAAVSFSTLASWPVTANCDSSNCSWLSAAPDQRAVAIEPGGKLLQPGLLLHQFAPQHEVIGGGPLGLVALLLGLPLQLGNLGIQIGLGDQQVVADAGQALIELQVLERHEQLPLPDLFAFANVQRLDASAVRRRHVNDAARHLAISVVPPERVPQHIAAAADHSQQQAANEQPPLGTLRQGRRSRQRERARHERGPVRRHRGRGGSEGAGLLGLAGGVGNLSAGKPPHAGSRRPSVRGW